MKINKLLLIPKVSLALALSIPSLSPLAATPLQHTLQQEALLSELVTSDDIFALKPHIDAETLVVLDLDDTTFCCKTMYGSGAWFSHLINQEASSNEERLAIVDKLYPTWIEAQKFVEVKPVDDRLPLLIREWQSLGIPVIALTARHPHLATCTLEQLATIGVDFSNNPFAKQAFSFEGHGPIHFASGVLLVGDYNNKGAVLSTFLKQAATSYKRVVFADDRKEHIETMQLAMKELQTEYVGLHYLGAASQAERFDPRVAAKQQEYLSKIVPDHIAAKLLQ